jgi:hypothetical protein
VNSQPKEPLEAMFDSAHVTPVVPMVTETVPLAVKPWPFTVSFVPAAAVELTSATLGLTSNVTSAPVELLEDFTKEESTAVTSYGFPSAESDGTLKLQENEPPDPIVELEQVTPIDPKVTVIVPAAVKPCPVTVSLLPTVAAAEEMEMLGAVVVVEEVVCALARGAPASRAIPKRRTRDAPAHLEAAEKSRLLNLNNFSSSSAIAPNQLPSFHVALKKYVAQGSFETTPLDV